MSVRESSKQRLSFQYEFCSEIAREVCGDPEAVGRLGRANVSGGSERTCQSRWAEGLGGKLGRRLRAWGGDARGVRVSGVGRFERMRLDG